MSVNQGVMRIGEVHAELRKVFPNVELSKIRYYEDKGLVQPSRSRKGYRLYSERDVECLREAIRLAQEEFVPLRVVRLRLIEQGLLDPPNASTNGRHVAREASVGVINAPAPTPTVPRTPLSVVPPRDEVIDDIVSSLGLEEGTDTPTRVKEYFSTNDLLATTGLSPEEFNQIHALGLVSSVYVNGETCFSALDVRVAAHSRALLARGVEPRILGSLRRIAEREIGVVDDLTFPLRQTTTEYSDDQVRVITADVAREVAALRNVLVERELNEYLRG
ncbi:MAG TPA: MerR family transcriptional regulator [Acidimicrobiales bacterium]|jgi:DNA-binding transcriptional MerR regulator|nr:MerR family transcriptional regulator [Acidimicrobiales bacterium]